MPTLIISEQNVSEQIEQTERIAELARVRSLPTMSFSLFFLTLAFFRRGREAIPRETSRGMFIVLPHVRTACDDVSRTGREQPILAASATMTALETTEKRLALIRSEGALGERDHGRSLGRSLACPLHGLRCGTRIRRTVPVTNSEPEIFRTNAGPPPPPSSASTTSVLQGFLTVLHHLNTLTSETAVLTKFG